MGLQEPEGVVPSESSTWKEPQEAGGMSQRDQLPTSGEPASHDAHLDFKIKRKNVRLLVARHRRLQELIFRSAETDEYPRDADVRSNLQRTYERLLAERARASRAYADKLSRETAVGVCGDETVAAGCWANRTSKFLDMMEKEVDRAGLAGQSEEQSVENGEDARPHRGRREEVTGTYVPFLRKGTVDRDADERRAAAVQAGHTLATPKARPPQTPNRVTRHGIPSRSLIRKHIAGESSYKPPHRAVPELSDSNPASETPASVPSSSGFVRSWKSLRETRKLAAQNEDGLATDRDRNAFREQRHNMLAATRAKAIARARWLVRPRRVVARTPPRIRFRRVEEKPRATAHGSDMTQGTLRTRRQERHEEEFGSAQQAWEDLWALSGPAQPGQLDRENGVEGKVGNGK